MGPKRVISSSLLKEKNVSETHVSNDDEQLLEINEINFLNN